MIDNGPLGGEQMKHQRIVLKVLLAVLALSGNLWALPTTAYEAKLAVTGWLKADPQPLGMTLGQEVTAVETFTDDFGTTAYHIVYLHPYGFVIVSADDMIEPIIGFADDGVFDPAPDRPLGALVTNDINGRIAVVNSTFSLMAISPQTAVTETQRKWEYLIGLGATPSDGFALMGEPPIEDNNLSDIRVAPLIKSKWGQIGTNGDDSESPACYNYYTPQNVDGRASFVEGDPSNYPSGCVATSMAQLMRYNQHPREPIEPKQFTITVDGHTMTRELLRGEGPDGAYNWVDMLLSPGNNATDEQRRAIGALCHDAGIAVGMEYTDEGSGATLYDAAAALVDTFGYSSAILGENGESIRSRRELRDMINPNLDAGLPVIVGIKNSSYSNGGHAPVCDGYGYNNSTLYHHFNMGWNGHNDCWYNLPDVNCPDGAPYDLITRCVYNVFTEGRGEIISGRIIDSEGRPIRNAVVTAQSHEAGTRYSAKTNSKGIYVLMGVASDSTYTVTAERFGYDFVSDAGFREVAIERSSEGSSNTGNTWGVDFRGYSNNEGDVIVGNIKLTASDGRAGDHFGCSVSISGDYAIVGAYGDDSKRGSAYVFKREGAGWVEQAKLRVLGEERLGFSVAISGDYAIVGAGSAQGDRDPGGSYSAHVFKRNDASWTRQTSLSYPGDSAFGVTFGGSVSISGDRVIVGAPNDSLNVNRSDLNSGSAFVYEHNDESWIFQARIRPSDIRRSDNFGGLVSISGDYVITASDFSGRWGMPYGPVYIFKRDGMAWTEQAKLTTLSLPGGDLFGNSIAISEDCAIVGAPRGDGNKEGSGLVHLYNREGTNWTRQTELTALDGDSFDLFGDSVAISGDYIIVGATNDHDDYMGDEAGSAYVFKRDGEAWTQQAKLTAPDGEVHDHFGRSVSIDGRYVIVGADDDDDKGGDSGSAYIFERIGSTWMP
jgi:hypothetical protein